LSSRKSVISNAATNRGGHVSVGTISPPAPLPRVRARLSRLTDLRVTVGMAFAIRLATILVRKTYEISSVNQLANIAHFKFGFESGMVAGSLASGAGFSSPFGGSTGPTAWLAPVYPYLTAGVFKLFGIYTSSSAFVLLALNSLFSALTCIPLYYIARRFSDKRIATWTAWLWALLPPAIYWSVRWIWETSLSALLLTTAIWLTFRLEKEHRLRWWMTWGALWGLLALTNPSCCSVLPFVGIWLCYRRWRLGERFFLHTVAAAAVCLVLMAPWEVRNYLLFHTFVPVRDNAGAELRMGNGPHAVGLWMSWAHPSQNPVQLALFKRLGEKGYIAEREAEAVRFIRENPGRFARLCLVRMVYFWAGVPRPSVSAVKSALHNWFFLLMSVLALGGLVSIVRQRIPGAAVLVAATAIYPIIYYVTFVDPRYRHPIEPLLVFLGAYLVSQAREFQSRTQPQAVTATADDLNSTAA
jgi:4-amino-4-deoxy-L-arabinose transferase-like glycosyltransferase